MKRARNNPRISIIIPAANEEAFIGRALDSIRQQKGPECEIIVVVNGSTDTTARKARTLRDALVITFPEMLGYSRARNEGARRARGDMLVFLDADSYLAPSTLKSILDTTKQNMFGTVLGGPDTDNMLYHLFFFLKNSVCRSGLMKGVLGGLFFCDASLFRTIGGYDENLYVDENSDILRRASAAGGAYTVIPSAAAYTSMRRFEKQGVFRSILFWVKIKLYGLFGQKHKIGRVYSSSHDRF